MRCRLLRQFQDVPPQVSNNSQRDSKRQQQKSSSPAGKLKVYGECVCDPSKLLFPAGFGVLTFYLAQATGTLICQYDVRMFCCVTHSCVGPFSRYSSCDIGPVLLGKSFPKPFFPFPHFLMQQSQAPAFSSKIGKKGAEGRQGRHRQGYFTIFPRERRLWCSFHMDEVEINFSFASRHSERRLLLGRIF